MKKLHAQNLAPIALFVYNRLEHLKQTMKALNKNELATQSDLIIFSDGPKNQEDSLKVEKVREYLKSIYGFKQVNIIERNKNLGLANNIISGVTEVVSQYEKIIVLEDDLVTSPYFLQYMNTALDFYKENENVISIHGYIYPINHVFPETFFLKGADCLGWATWSNRWKLFEPDGNILLNKIYKNKLIAKFNFNKTYPFLKMLKDQIAGKNSSWAVRWYATAFLLEKLTLYPCKTLVSHIGYDEGTHCRGNAQKPEQLQNKKILINTIPVKEDESSKKIIMKYFKKRQKSLLKKIIFKIVALAPRASTAVYP